MSKKFTDIEWGPSATAKRQLACRICGNGGNNTAYRAREMMFGYRDHFTYFQCATCGCLQIDEVPHDMSRYYPADYYSFSARPRPEALSGSGQRLKASAKRRRNLYAAFGRGALGKLLYCAFPNPLVQDLLAKTFPPDGVAHLGIKPRSRILDVGCGTGDLLLKLHEVGFENLVGVDPYLKTDIRYPNRVCIFKRTIHEVCGSWNLIMFHHSFEHLEDPGETLRAVARLLAKGGLCVIRIPIVPSYAWKQYREKWVQLDPPRHYFIHSSESMRLLTEQVGLRIERIVYDSTHFQFWGSEQYLRDIPLLSDRSYAVTQDRSLFTDEQIRHYEEMARLLNARGEGDQAAFYIRSPQ